MFVLLVHWRKTLRPRLFLIGLCMTVVLLSVQTAVVTRRERADRTMREIETAVLDSRADGIRPWLARSFHINETNWDTNDFINEVREWMRAVDVRTLHRRALRVEDSADDAFQVYISYIAEIRHPNYNGRTLSRWWITFTRESGGWRISEIQPVELNRQNLSGWRSLGSP